MKKTPTNKATIKKAFRGVDHEQLRLKLKTSKVALSQIVNGLIIVSPQRAKDIERITCGKVKAKVLRPDIF